MKKTAAFLLAPLVLVFAACGDDDGGGGSASGWCDLANDVEAQGTVFDDLDMGDPTSIEEAFNSSVDLLDRAVDAAPDEIRGDVETVSETFTEFRDQLEAADWNLLDVDMSTFESSAEELDAATANIEAFNEEECGITSEDTTEDAPEGTTAEDGGDTSEDTTAEETQSSLGEGTVRDQLVDQFVSSGFTEEEATCLADNFDMSATDQADMMQLFDDCGIDLARLAELGESLGG